MIKITFQSDLNVEKNMGSDLEYVNFHRTLKRSVKYKIQNLNDQL